MLVRLRVKLICVNMLLVTGMLCVIFSFLYQATKQNLEAESLRMLEAAAEPFGPGPSAARFPDLRLRVGRDGELTAWGEMFSENPELLRELYDRVNQDRGQAGVLEDYNLRYFRAMTPEGQIILFADLSAERSTLRGLVQTCLIVGAAAFLVFLLISLLFAHWAVKPVERAWERQRQFVADASHELKTPLTVILTNAELLQSADYDGPTRARLTEHILAMSRQMRGLVENLLDLARLDSGAAKPAMTRLNLSELLADEALVFEPLYYEHGLTLCAELDGDIFVSGGEAQLRQAARVLLDNAMKYTAAPAAVHARLVRHGSRCRFTVENPGQTLSAAELKNIFRRFYRADKARAMNHSYGLGLPIAEGIAREHRGRLWAESRDGRVTFCLELPMIS